MILVAIGGFFGAIARFWLSSRFNSTAFPFGTLGVNVLGALLLGLLIGSGAGGSARLLFGTGFLGAFTTFSTWLFEAEQMKMKKAFLYIFLTCAAGFFGAWLGL
ncbi:CrcB family protein [Domibacillus indicus]|uniref:fluoride efflux transporter FluC n=1 Tax=Domibacillus indicus TaxID=1437523 RepID=UPI00203DC7C2|nr:CrcB family protein [Domibacillus indicus]MCM3790408.1 CrcB family protein [Domibacillus indicus]